LSNPRRIAVATSLSKMINYMVTGEAFYSVAEACHDCYLDFLIAESIATGLEVIGHPHPWM
jgi:hypothetical protein